MRYLLIGTEGKRKEYFFQAWHQYQQQTKGEKNLLFFDIETPDLISKLLPKDCIKIDPIKNDSIYLDDLTINMEKYQQILRNLKKYEDGIRQNQSQSLSLSGNNIYSSIFMNSPQTIAISLDKKRCKQILMEKGLKVTPMLDFKGENLNQLLDFLSQNRISQIFIKPNRGSGAAGIVALRYHLRTHQIIAQTSIYPMVERDEKGGEVQRWVNTKKLRILRNRQEIEEIVNYLLSMDFIVERWMPKASVEGIIYDLRVVYQFGKISFIQARGTKTGGITNLHLNNMPLSLKQIGLKEEQIADIQSLCAKSVACFEDLNVAGFDIFLEKHQKTPYIIEINAQGDLMYQDIYHKNEIYKQQIEMMVEKWQEK